MKKSLSPKEIYQTLNQTVIGQSDYLEKLSVALWMHQQKIQMLDRAGCYYHLNYPKVHVMAVGPTGSGKTLALQTAAKLLDFDLFLADMSFYTASGWKGKNIESLFGELLDQCGGDIKRAEHAVVFLDEIDKCIVRSESESESGSDSSVERNLLKIMEGSMVSVSSEKDAKRLNTENMLFICAGAFEGIEKKIKYRVSGGDLVLGFGAPLRKTVGDRNILSYATKDDLAAYGVGRQFLGRFGSVANLNELTKETLADILLYSDSSVVNSYRQLFKDNCMGLEIDRKGALAVAGKAIEQKTGARGLTDILSETLRQTLFMLSEDLRGQKLLITADENEEPVLKLVESDEIELEKPTAVAQTREVKPWRIPITKRHIVFRYCYHIVGTCQCLVQTQTADTLYALADMMQIMFGYIREKCADTDYSLKGLHRIWECYAKDREVFDRIIDLNTTCLMRRYQEQVNQEAVLMTLHAIQEYQYSKGHCTKCSSLFLGRKKKQMDWSIEDIMSKRDEK